MSDFESRQLERAAMDGDREAEERFGAARARLGGPGPAPPEADGPPDAFGALKCVALTGANDWTCAHCGYPGGHVVEWLQTGRTTMCPECGGFTLRQRPFEWRKFLVGLLSTAAMVIAFIALLRLARR